MSNANLSFLPWVRQGVASAIAVQDPLDATLKPVASIQPTVTLNGNLISGTPTTIRGPVDVLGIDPNQVIRTDPRPATSDFEPNCFASIEFDRPDFPWLFTPAASNANHHDRLRPWLCLIVVQKRDGVTLTEVPDSPLSKLRITAPAKINEELPDLVDSWAWAHAQVAAEPTDHNDIRTALSSQPELTLSRLICPRMLSGESDYIACVVPTFDLGRRTGLGEVITDKELTDAATTLKPAWVLSPLPNEVLLPVYYHWEFRTSARGDFESLAKRLKPGLTTNLGTRTIDISAPCFPAAGATTLDLEGALLPISPPPPAPNLPAGFKTNLAGIINEPDRLQAVNPSADPVLGAPIYGRWHAASNKTSPTDTGWLHELNLDPRWRVAAAFGTRVVQQQQEALMASAWDQAADLATANQRMRQLQLSLVVSESLHRRHLSTLREEELLRVAAPAFSRLMSAPNSSLLAAQSATRLPIGANRPAMRRIGRQRGALTRRLASHQAPRSPYNTWVARLNEMWAEPTPPPQNPPPPPPPPQLPTMDLAQMPSLALLTPRVNDGQSHYGVFFVAQENAAVTPPGTRLLRTNRTEVPDFFRAAARTHLSRFFPMRNVMIRPHSISLSTVREAVLDQMQPRVALKALASAIIETGDGVLAPVAPGVTATGLETVMAAPYFPQPMYESLRDVSQDLLLPGLDRVPPDSVFGLRSNRKFVEAYMAGLNHEMARELLWRGYPTDQRGTYFDRFWSAASNVRDITVMHEWRTRALGQNGDSSVAGEKFVLLLRSVLLKRYPNAVLYLVRAVPAGIAPDPNALVPSPDASDEVLPMFSGSMQPDVAFLGFSVTVDQATGADGSGGYYLIIQEHPTEPRFGIDEGLSVGASHLRITPQQPTGLDLQGGQWNTTAANMALITRRLPTRLAIHVSWLIRSA